MAHQVRGRAPGPGAGAALAPGELAALVGIAAFAGFSLSCWLDGGLAALACGHRWPRVPVGDALGIGFGVVLHSRDPRLAWPVRWRRDLPGAVGWYAVLAGLWAATAASVAGTRHVVARLAGRRRPARGKGSSSGAVPTGAAWAGPAQVAPLVVARPGAGRLALGHHGRRLLAVERGQSLLVVGPTQCGKTSGLAVPALLEWDGPVLATSVKTDLVRDSSRRRKELGRVLVFDPTGVCDVPSAGWSPLAGAGTWRGALRVASGLCGVARPASGGLEDAGFWYATAEKLLAPLLFAAATSGGSISDVVRWVDTGEVVDVMLALELAGVAEALRAAEASFSRDERQRSSVYTTAETVLAAYADPSVAASCEHHDVDPASLLDGGGHTLYLVAPAHEQERLQPVFVALIRSVVEEALTLASRRGRPLDPPLLVVLDEAANIAPLAGLDTLASTAASHGIQLVTVWQDLAQVEARYGARAATVVNNHRAKLLCSGVADSGTLEQVSRLIGDEDRQVGSSSVDASGQWTRSSTDAQRRLAPADWLRCLAPGEAVLLYGHLPPLLLRLRPFFADRRLRQLAAGGRGRQRSARRRLRLRLRPG